MAADVKIGLLLSLVLVFVLAFALSRVPYSGDQKTAGDLTPVMVSGPPGIRPEIPPEALPSEPIPQAARAKPEPGVSDGTTERFRVPLSEAAPPDQVTQDTEPPKAPEPAAAPPVVRYIVRDGDSLAYIARKFYGPTQGNKLENVMKIFEANRGILKSPNQIDVGQELVIPPLEAAVPPRPGAGGQAAAQAQKPAQQSPFPDSMFEKVESVGRKRL